MKINLRIELNSGESKEVICSAADLVRFEQHFNMSVAVLDAEMKFTHLMYLAWSSEFRRKETAKEFDVWIDDIASVEASTADPK